MFVRGFLLGKASEKKIRANLKKKFAQPLGRLLRGARQLFFEIRTNFFFTSFA
jgi:hypothetical protein